MEKSNSPDKEFKIMVMKMLAELRKEWRNTMRTSTKRKYRKVPNRNQRTEEYHK